MSINNYFAGQPVPENEKYAYIIARDGFYILKRNGLFEACVAVDTIPELAEQEQTFTLKAKKIPYELIRQVLAFFYAVYLKHKSEAAVLLCYENEEWSVTVPEQRVSAGSVKYSLNGNKRVVGSIHSHPGFGAFASGTDQNDELNHDGLHLIFSRFDEIKPELACYAVVNGVRFELEPEYLIEGIPDPVNLVDSNWLEKVKTSETALFGDGQSLPTFREARQVEIPTTLKDAPEDVPEEWICEKCIHQDVCYQDEVQGDGTCRFYEFDPRRAAFHEQNKKPPVCRACLSEPACSQDEIGTDRKDCGEIIV